jgi:hypothetical protein
VLDIGDHDGRGVQVELLHSVIGAKGEQRGTGAIYGEAVNKIKSWDGIMSDMLCPNIP